jgi:hypothetical protein
LAGERARVAGTHERTLLKAFPTLSALDPTALIARGGAWRPMLTTSPGGSAGLADQAFAYAHSAHLLYETNSYYPFKLSQFPHTAAAVHVDEAFLNTGRYGGEHRFRVGRHDFRYTGGSTDADSGRASWYTLGAGAGAGGTPCGT